MPRVASHPAPVAAGGHLTAQFNPLYRPYLVVTIGLTMACTIIGLPLAVVWFCGVGQWWARHYFDLLQCTIDGKVLRFRKGILFQVEKTIPLENIQDVTFIEGPILRRFDLATLKFETAGHSVGQASDMHLTGIIQAHEFRNRILAQRDALKHHAAPAGGTVAMAEGQADLMRAMLVRLDEIAGLLRERRGGNP